MAVRRTLLCSEPGVLACGPDQSQIFQAASETPVRRSGGMGAPRHSGRKQVQPGFYVSLSGRSQLLMPAGDCY